MGWTVQVGEWERDITFNFSPPLQDDDCWWTKPASRRYSR